MLILIGQDSDAADTAAAWLGRTVMLLILILGLGANNAVMAVSCGGG